MSFSRQFGRMEDSYLTSANVKIRSETRLKSHLHAHVRAMIRKELVIFFIRMNICMYVCMYVCMYYQRTMARDIIVYLVSYCNLCLNLRFQIPISKAGLSPGIVCET